jgi:hypothetical protein
MNTPYTYLIGWSTHKVYYYGRRTAKKCDPFEFWKTYFTSSKEVAKYRDLHGEPDIIKIRKTFSSIEACKLWEERFLRKVDARRNPHFLNKVNSDHKTNPVNTGPCSVARKQAIKEARLNTPKLECLYCHRHFGPGNFKQFHGERCRLNPDLEAHIYAQRSERAKRGHQTAITRGTHHNPKPPNGNLTCPHCDYVGNNFGNMHRLHFDRCSLNPNIIPTKRLSTMNVRKTCEYCSKETNIGNYTKHHGIKCISYRESAGIAPQS